MKAEGLLGMTGGLLLASLSAALAPAPEEVLKTARTLLVSGRPDEAVPALEAAVAARPKDGAALRLLAAAYAAVSDERFEATYRRAIALSPGDFPLRLELVEALWQAGRGDGGNAEMDRLLREAGGPRLHLRYAFELMRQDRFADASREFERACRGAACDAEALEAWGSSLLETGRFAESAARYREAIARAPDRVSARQGLGRVLLLAGDPASARQELSRAVEVQPDSPEILLDLGRALEAIGQPEGAEDAYRRAIELAPGLPRARYALGTLLARRGRDEEARREIALYQKAFEREQRERFVKGARRAELALGWTDLASGQSEKALAQFERHPDDPEALRGKAAALSRLARHAEAVTALERALSISPADPRIRYALAREQEKVKTP
jgi:protein O-GlcNAc transferase